MKEYIKKGSWNKRAFSSINKLIADYGKDNPNYNPNKKPFAVFDWDNTSIIGDVEEASFYYLVTNLAFKLNPDELYEIIRKNVDKKTLPTLIKILMEIQLILRKFPTIFMKHIRIFT